MDNYFDHIEDYLKGHLSQEEAALFESEMSADEQLAFAVKEYQLLQATQDVLIEDDIQASIDEVRAELDLKQDNSREDKSAKQFWLRPVGIAASVVLLLGLGYMLMQGFNQTVPGDRIYAMSEAELLEKYFRDPVDPTERGSNETVEKVMIDSPQKPCEIAHQLMANKQYKKALKTFSYSLNDSDPNCRWKSEFYSSLIHALLGDEKESKVMLDKITSDVVHGYNTKAKSLLLDLN